MEERLQKILAAAGVASRREAEKIIAAGRVRVNSKVVIELGSKFDPDKVRIAVDGKPIKAETKAYYLFYKPRGVVTTMSDPQNRRSIADFVQDLPERVFPVGRLDYNTEGLLLLTNDGALAQALMHPSHEVNKTYLVKVPGIVPDVKMDMLRVGVKLEDGLTAPAIVNLRTYDHEHNFTLFDITIHEGRNRQVRRMCESAGMHCTRLRRIQEGGLSLGPLPVGKWRYLTEEEVRRLQK